MGATSARRRESRKRSRRARTPKLGIQYVGTAGLPFWLYGICTSTCLGCTFLSKSAFVFSKTRRNVLGRDAFKSDLVIDALCVSSGLEGLPAARRHALAARGLLHAEARPRGCSEAAQVEQKNGNTCSCLIPRPERMCHTCEVSSRTAESLAERTRCEGSEFTYLCKRVRT